MLAIVRSSLSYLLDIRAGIMTASRVFLLLLIALVIAWLVVWVIASRATAARVAELDAQRSLIETRHGTLEYSKWGEGPLVLVVHGAGGGFDQGRLLADAVGGDGFSFIAVSRFGYLGSELPKDPSTAAQAEAFIDLLDALEIDRVHILAMSGGVPPTLKLAEMFPGRVGKMALLSSAPFTPFSPDIEDRPIPTWAYSALLGNDTVYWFLSKTFRGQLRAAFDARPELLDSATPGEVEFVKRLIDGFLSASRRVAGVNNEGAAIAPSANYKLAIVQSLVLVIHARDDRLNPVAVADILRAEIPDAKLVIFDEGDHLLLVHHEDIAQEIATHFR